ncbi:hypothetical protein INT47_003981 [Mucor saturninus]|uniref:CBM21 domain-containing protein n=1 Tax=Mucor saturninus TaxID=64648 RepID=A0A8H7R9P6_9FUNG|nr:hypothetical protein INT47_003981 [Mucor saturninus]
MGITTFSQNKWGGRSDFSRPSVSSSTTTTTMVEAAKEEETVQISQPRFSVFGKKAKFNSINQNSLLLDKESSKNTAPKIQKFEIHPSTISAANIKQQQDDLKPVLHSKSKKSVSFDPIFLERVCLFRETQAPQELKEAHDKRLENPPFRLLCPNWPGSENNDSNILLNKKSFTITHDNQSIKGKLSIRNLALDKSVSIRYTLDGWTSVTDVDAVFFGPNPKNVAFDIYEFSMDLGFGHLSDHGEMRGKLEFLIRFSAGDMDYMDNNHGRNYQIKIIADPLNDPWASEKQLEKIPDHHQYPDNNSTDDDTEEEEEIEEEEEEKHNQFTNALKGYKHAKPFHLNKRQPWLGTRYDFGQSLSLAKRAPYESWSHTVKPDPTFINDYFLAKPISIQPSNTDKSSKTVSVPPTPPKVTSTTSTPTIPSFKPTYTTFSSSSAPPSPRTSPTLSSSTLPLPRPAYHQSQSTSAVIDTLPSSNSPLDIHSSDYLYLVNKYCFYNGDDSKTDDSVNSV